MDKTRLEKLKQLLEITNDGLTKAEFLETFKKVFNQVLQIETKVLEKVNKAISDLKGQNNASLDTLKADFKRVSDDLGNMVAKALKEQENGLNFIRDKVRRIQNGIDGKDGVDGLPGKDADEEKILNELLKQVPDNKEDFEKLEKEIQELKEKIDNLPTRKGGGGTSAIGVAQTFKWIAHTEQPSGLINGSNRTYTVNNNIWWIAGFTLNGEQIAELPNFTYVGKTITFASAIPADYATKDFEVKYIGT